MVRFKRHVNATETYEPNRQSSEIQYERGHHKHSREQSHESSSFWNHEKFLNNSPLEATEHYQMSTETQHSQHDLKINKSIDSTSSLQEQSDEEVRSIILQAIIENDKSPVAHNMPDEFRNTQINMLLHYAHNNNLEYPALVDLISLPDNNWEATVVSNLHSDQKFNTLMKEVTSNEHLMIKTNNDPAIDSDPRDNNMYHTHQICLDLISYGQKLDLETDELVNVIRENPKHWQNQVEEFLNSKEIIENNGSSSGDVFSSEETFHRPMQALDGSEHRIMDENLEYSAMISNSDSDIQKIHDNELETEDEVQHYNSEQIHNVDSPLVATADHVDEDHHSSKNDDGDWGGGWCGSN